MLQYEELRLRLEELKPAIDDLKFAIGVEKIKQEIAQSCKKPANLRPKLPHTNSCVQNMTTQ